ncbi:hypothetical protein [Serratia marcescens]|uniref:hypothetical protein n=1 Tax=Serratia marcescens TaxID=615 RepID=UPI0024A79E4B|nr:hypothetical protein [Serratia marcescens]
MKHDTDYYIDKILTHDRHNNKVEAMIGMIIIVSGIVACLLAFVFKNINPIILIGLIIFSFIVVQVVKKRKVASSSTVFTMFDDCAQDEEFREFFIPLFEQCLLIGRAELREIDGFISQREKRLTDIRRRSRVLKAIKLPSKDE